MKNLYSFMVSISFYLLVVTPISAQDHSLQTSKDSPLVLFEAEIAESFAHMAPNAEFLSNKSYEWINKWMPDFRQHRFDSESWLTIKDHFKIGVESPNKAQAMLRVFDADGKLKFEEKHELEKGTNRFPIEAASWGKGGYIVQLQTKNGGILKKVIKI